MEALADINPQLDQQLRNAAANRAVLAANKAKGTAAVPDGSLGEEVERVANLIKIELSDKILSVTLSSDSVSQDWENGIGNPDFETVIIEIVVELHLND